MSETPDSEVKESSEYDNYLDQVNDSALPETPTSLATLFGIEEQEEPTEKWKKHWKGMPEFEQEENKPYKRLIISFRTEEDYKEFAKMINQPLTEKTKSTWHPRLDRAANSLCRWIEDE